MRRKKDTDTNKGESEKRPRLFPAASWFASPRLLISWLGLVLLAALPRLTTLNQYLIVDEADRWRWAEDFVYALSRGDLAGTRVGDGYPGIVPVWAESIWIFLEAIRRSLVEGRWIGEAGLYLIFHEWDRSAYLFQQRLPIVLLNIVLVLAIIWAVWRLFGARVALVSSVLIALDPFYLSDSRVNRAEAVITGLMTLSILALVFYHHRQRLRYVLLSGFLGGLGFLTKIQTLALLPGIALISLFIFWGKKYEVRSKGKVPYSLLPTPYRLLPTAYCLLPTAYSLLLWSAAAALTWFLFWPSMWVTPLETLTLVYNYATRKVGAEGVNLFFMGQTYANADPGPIFYPFVFLMRITPLALLGFTFYVFHLSSFISRNMQHTTRNTQHASSFQPPVSSFILVIFIFVYALIMTLGSHKQDRYLMPIFPSLDILAAIGLVGAWVYLKDRLRHYTLHITQVEGLLCAGLCLVQLAIVLPHHPYYYSYFNPLLGDGPTAVRTMRVGWGEGMDQVGAYLAAKPNSRQLTVSSRFTHNMLGFKGELISLLPDGRWTQADYIVLYIQQVQRRQEPGPGFIDYFQARTPEKVITIGGIDYAWIYPIPFTTPADPQFSLIPGQAALLGYRWESRNGETANGEKNTTDSPFVYSAIRLFWENLGWDGGRQWAARLVGATVQTEWTACSADPAFMAQTQMPGAYIESLCSPVTAGLPPGTYTVEFGLLPAGLPLGREEIKEEIEVFSFPQGWHAATITATGAVADTPEPERLQAVANEAVPANVPRPDRIYDGRLKLVAYRLNPPAPKPGETVVLTLYWQAVKEVTEPLRLTVQLADSRRLSLGRVDTNLPADTWPLGEVKLTQHTFSLAHDLESPLGAEVEAELRNQAEVVLRPTTQAGKELGSSLARFTVASGQWPTPTSVTPAAAAWQSGLALKGYTLSPQPAQPGQSLAVSLFWQADRPVAETYIVFVHLLDKTGQLKTQNDDLPRSGTYPIPWWQPGQIVEDTHFLTLPPDLPGGTYQLMVGLYRPEDGVRLLLSKGGDSFKIGLVEVK